MNLKHLVGTAINNVIEGAVSRNYKFVPFIPNGRFMVLDIKRAMINPKVIFDVGGNEGQTANYYAKNFKNASIYTFEPVLEAYQKMEANISDKRIKHFNQALGSEKGEAKIYKSKDYTGNSSLNGAHNSHLPN